MNSLLLIAVQLGRHEFQRLETEIELADLECKIESAKVAMTPEGGWEGKNIALQKVNAEKAFGKSDIKTWESLKRDMETQKNGTRWPFPGLSTYEEQWSC